MLASVSKMTASAVKSLRDHSLLDEVPKTEIAKKTGVDRNTVAHRFRAGDMPLSAFIGTSLAIGLDPSKIIADAMHQTEQEQQP